MNNFIFRLPYKSGVNAAGVEYTGDVISTAGGKFEGIVTEVPEANQTSVFVDAARDIFEDEETARRFVDAEWKKRFPE